MMVILLVLSGPFPPLAVFPLEDARRRRRQGWVCALYRLITPYAMVFVLYDTDWLLAA